MGEHLKNAVSIVMFCLLVYSLSCSYMLSEKVDVIQACMKSKSLRPIAAPDPCFAINRLDSEVEAAAFEREIVLQSNRHVERLADKSVPVLEDCLHVTGLIDEEMRRFLQSSKSVGGDKEGLKNEL